MKKHSYYLYSLQKACIKALKTGDDSEAMALRKHNEKKLKELYLKLLSGKINVFFTKSKCKGYNPDDVWECCTAWHRSTRPGVLIQESHMWFKNGECQPTYHANINSFDDLLRENGYPTGQWYKTA